MDEGDAPAVGRLGGDLVAEDGAPVLGPQLLQIRAAEPTGQHAHELARPLGLRDVGEPRPPSRI